MISIGKHRARGSDGGFGESSQAKTKFVRVPFVITQGEFTGQSVSWDGYFTDGARDRTIQSLRYCGCTFPGDDITNLEGIDKNEVEIVVEHEPYTFPVGHARAGESITRVRVAWVNGGTGGIREEEQMDPAKKAAFAASMKGALVAARMKSGGSASSPNGGKRAPAPKAGQWDGTGPDPSGVEDQGIPF